MEVGLITGDNSLYGRSMWVDQLGISNILSEVLPGGKSKEIEKLQTKGLLVGMVGDGINDAPALAQVRSWYRYGGRGRCGYRSF